MSGTESESMVEENPQPKPMKRKLDNNSSGPEAGKVTAAMIVPKLSTARPTDKAKNHICLECGKSFVQKQKLNQHIHSKHGGERVKCEMCDKTFAYKSGMQVHVRTAHNNEKFKCVECGSEYKSASGLKEHKKTHCEQIERFQCNFCYKSYTQRPALREHIKFYHTGEEKDFKCHICSKLFTRPYHLKQHIGYTHEKTITFPCSECNSKFYMKKVLAKHRRPKKCKVCKITINCSTKMEIHRRSHIMTCVTCNRVFTDLRLADEHAKNSHVKWVDCNRCSSKFTSKTYLPTHMVNVHNQVKCFACPQTFAKNEQMLTHCKEGHPGEKCLLCTEEPRFVYFSLRQLASHISDSHGDRIFLCKKCGQQFLTSEELIDHNCSKCFLSVNVKTIALLKILKVPFNSDSAEDNESDFCNEEDMITRVIPGFPLQATSSIDSKLNRTEKQLNQKLFSIFVNQSQALIKNGSRTLLVWCAEVNCLSYCCELIKYDRCNGIIIRRPTFDRSKIKFHRAENDTLYNIPTSTLEDPYDLGHAHAAANCWTLNDFLQSFSNLNYWAMHRKLNRIHWQKLERHIRESAMRYREAYVTTGVILRKNGKVTNEYVRGVIVPEGFYKIAFFHDFNGRYDVKAWLMKNNGDVQNVDECEVSVRLIEKMTKCYYLHQEVLDKIKPESIKRHVEDLPHHNAFFGVQI